MGSESGRVCLCIFSGGILVRESEWITGVIRCPPTSPAHTTFRLDCNNSNIQTTPTPSPGYPGLSQEIFIISIFQIVLLAVMSYKHISVKHLISIILEVRVLSNELNSVDWADSVVAWLVLTWWWCPEHLNTPTDKTLSQTELPKIYRVSNKTWNIQNSLNIRYTDKTQLYIRIIHIH